MLMIFTGSGKGKTTAALGQALRCIGHDKRVLMVQFIKGPWKTGEDAAQKLLSPYLSIEKMGLGFVGILGDKLPREDHIAAAKGAATFACKEAKSKKWDAIILDEVWNALKLGLLTEREVETTMEKILMYTEELIMTGRDCPEKFIEKANIATEMRELVYRSPHAESGVEF